MANLRPIVEISWTTDAFDPAPVWVDVSAYVMMDSPGGLTITRGRSDQYSTVSGSVANFVLDNQDGRFTPERAASPYYPNVVNEKRVRISVTDGVTTWRRFYGFIDVMTPSWSPGGFHSVVNVTCVDWFKFLSKARLRNIISSEYMALNPFAYYPLGDAEGSDRAANLADSDHPAFVTGKTVTFGVGTGPGTDGITAATLAAAGQLGTKYQTVKTIPSGIFSLAVWFNCASAPGAGNDRRLISLPVGSGVDVKRLAIEAVTGNLVTSTMTSGSSVCDGLTHLAVFTYSGTGTQAAKLYLDGSLVDSDTLIISGTWSELGLGNDPLGDFGFSTFQGTLAHAAVFYDELTAAEVASIWKAGNSGGDNESAGTRFLDLGRLAGIASSELATTATKPVQFVDSTNQDVLTMMRAVEVTEAGVIYVDVNGVLRFQGHNDRYNQPAAISLTAGQYENDLQPVLDDFGIYDVATVSAPDLPEQTVSRGLGDSSPANLSTLDIDTERMLSRARWETRNPSPKLRWPSISVDLLTQTSIRAAVLTADIGARIALAGLPSSAPATSVEVFMEGYTETISLTAYNVTFNCSPFTPTNLWKLGDATYSVLGSTTVLAF